MKKLIFRNIIKLLLTIIITTAISMENVTVVGATDLTKTEKVILRNEYINQVLLDEHISSKYQFYSTDLSNYNDGMQADSVEERKENYKELSDFTTNLVLGASSDADKLNRIYNWVVDNIYYDYDYYYNKTTDVKYDAYGVFKEKKTICEGYSNLLRYMLLSQNIPAVKITGMALGLGTSRSWETTDITSTNHAWVMAYINSEWVNLDATWDSGNKYENGTYTKNSRTWRYYMCSDSYISSTHMMQEVNNNLLDNINKSGLFYEDNKYYYYDNGNKIVEEDDFESIYYSSWYDCYDLDFRNSDGSIYFDRDSVEFRDSKLSEALISGGYDINKDGEISIGELNQDKIVLKDKGITDLSGLEYARWTTEELDLSNNKITDVSILTSFMNLYEVNLSHNLIKDYTSLPLLNLETLDLSYNSIENVDNSDANYYIDINLKGNPIKAKNVTINKVNVTMKKKQTLQLKVSVLPTLTLNKEVIWSSNNKKVATVSNTGKVTAKGKGTATITCITQDGSNIKKTCKIIVK